MKNCNKLAKAIRLALVFGATATTGVMSNAHADVEEVNFDEVERIEVTGSRIKRTDMETSSPVQITSAEDIKVAGFTRVEDMLNTLPQIEASSTAFEANGASGRGTIDMRGLGAKRTLVLINGRRMQPGGGSDGVADVNSIPSALVKRVEVMTGGGSSVYGADAVAGVVNFIMDNDFEGFKVDLGASGYQHDNDNKYIQGLMDEKGFEYESGNTGIDGTSFNIDVTAGGAIGSKGHAVAYATYKRTNELRQSARDYASCALNEAGTACGGSGNAVIPNFYLLPLIDEDGDGVGDYGDWSNYRYATLSENSEFIDSVDNLYNYEPINHFMRPDEKYTFGAFVNYDVNDAFKPYLEFMYMNDKTSAQIAESGTFFNQEYHMSLDSDLLNDAQRDYLTDELGVEDGEEFGVYIGKRNVEGGPRVSIIEHSSFKLVLGSEGEINDNWTYDFSLQVGNTTSTDTYINDFYSPSITEALSADGETCTDDCVPYEVFTYNGVTSEQADTLTAVAMLKTTSEQLIMSGFVTGELDYTIPTASMPIAVVFGSEYRDEQFERISDDVYETGALLGQGGPTPSLKGGYSVRELYMEASLPLIDDVPGAESLVLDLGYRYSDYDITGIKRAYKVAVDWTPIDNWKVRAGYNRAVRSPNIGELFTNQSIGLWSGSDPCAVNDDGVTPLSASQCALTGVTDAQYGNIVASPAGQYNQLYGGNPELTTEQADTYTLGLIGQVTEELNFSIDYWSIEMEDVIDSIDPELSVSQCAETGNELFCNNVHRSSAGSLWLGETGYVSSLNQNLGEQTWRGVDFTAGYHTEAFGGDLNADIIGTYMLKKETIAIIGVEGSTYDCAGDISSQCFPQPDWRHVMNVNYSVDDWGVNLKWRYLGKVGYGGDADLLIADGISSQTYIDLSGHYVVNENVTARVGMNNIFDKEKPITGNSVDVGAFYDSLGRFLHASMTIAF